MGIYLMFSTGVHSEDGLNLMHLELNMFNVYP